MVEVMAAKEWLPERPPLRNHTRNHGCMYLRGDQ